MIHRSFKLFVYYSLLSFFGLGTFLYNLICLLSYLLPGTESRRIFHQQTGVKLLRFFFWCINKTNLCHLHTPDSNTLESIEPSVIIANHTGLMDAIVINTLFPASSCVFKSKLRANPCFSHILQCGGHLCNDEGIDMIRKAADIAASGRHVVIFPEGTRKQEASSFSFKKGFALIAQRSQKPVALFAIHNPVKAFSKEQGIRAPALPIHISFDYLGQVKQDKNESIEQFVNRVESIYDQTFRTHEFSIPQNTSG